MYKPRHFKIEEWLPERYFKAMSKIYAVDRLWNIFDERILFVFDLLRDRYGPIIMNTWHSRTLMVLYGRHEWRGYRDHTSRYVRRDGTGAFGNLSQHRFGRAGDGVPLDTSAQAIRRDIFDDPWHDDFKHITCVEKGVEWLHVDTRNHNKSKCGILIV